MHHTAGTAEQPPSTTFCRCAWAEELLMKSLMRNQITWLHNTHYPGIHNQDILKSYKMELVKIVSLFLYFALTIFGVNVHNGIIRKNLSDVRSISRTQLV